MGASHKNEQSQAHISLKSLRDLRQWPYFFDALFAASFSLFVFARYLDFFLTPTINKVFVFLCLFALFFVFSIFFITPILNGLKNNPKHLIVVLLVSIVMTGALFVLLPDQKITIRTVHTLKVSITADSGSVIFENLLGPTSDRISLDELIYDGTIEGEAIILPPGGMLDYSREMTGGISFMLSALEEDAEAIVAWDGVESTYSLPKRNSIVLEMDPASVGRPSITNLFLLHLVKWNEWVFLFLTANIFLGLVYLWVVKKDFQYRIIHHGTQRYLLDYLVLAAILTLFAIVLRAYRPESVTRSMLILLPGLCYLVIKILYSVLPSLPLILVGLTVVVNIFAHWVWFDTDLLTVFQTSEQTFSELVIHVFPDDVTVLSLGYYRQLRGSEIILPEGSFLAEGNNVSRLKRLNYNEAIDIVDYPGELTADEYDRIIQLVDWSAWQRRNSGVFYFYKADLIVTSPIVVFTYLDDILLVPADQLDGLGLFNDFIFD